MCFMKKIYPLIALIVLCSVVFYVFFIGGNTSQDDAGSLPIVAITQIIEHPALDMERAAIINTLSANGFVDGHTIKIIYKNAQGNIATSSQITTQLMGQKPKVFVAISTPSAQSAVKLCREQKIPLVFSAVSAPVEAKLIGENGKSDAVVTGVSDRLSTPIQIQTIQKMLPHVKKIGIIYNTGEINSADAALGFRSYCIRHGLELSEAAVTKTSDVAQAAQSLIQQVDMIYVPNDNTAVAAMQSITQVALQHKMVVIAGDEGSVKMGALASIGYNRKMLGTRAGLQVVAILNGRKPQDIPIEDHHPIEILMNTQTMEKIGYQIPDGVKEDITFVGSKS